MKALQYIYTSWKNGNSTEKKGYMIYSKSSGITDAECDDIKFVMQYEVPKEMVPNPSPEQILNDFPYSFAYFGLSSGRVCIAQSTYLGRDYTGRFGNYIIHALVIEREELQDYPVEFFGEDFIKTYMTEEELNADSPVPPLEPLEIDVVGSVINDEAVMDFVMDREDELKYLVSAVLLSRKQHVPFYINDTRENIVMWIAALQKMFPQRVAAKITYSIYAGNHEKFHMDEAEARGKYLMVLGVRPDANYFSYVSEARSSRHIVMDLSGGHMTENIPVLAVARGLTDSYSDGMDDINRFGAFLDSIGYESFQYELEYAYQIYHIWKDSRYTYEAGSLTSILQFAAAHVTDAVNTETAMNLLEIVKSESENVLYGDMKALICYLYRYADFMAYSVHTLLLDFVYRLNEEHEPEEHIFELLAAIQRELPAQYQELLAYFVSGDVQGEHRLYLEGNPDRQVNEFYGSFLLKNYMQPSGQLRQGADVLLAVVADNLSGQPDCGVSVAKLLKSCADRGTAGQYVLALFAQRCSTDRMESVCGAVADFLHAQPDESAQTLLDALMDHSATAQTGINISARYIGIAKDPGQAFRRFYDRQKGRLEGDDAVDLGSVIDAYLENDHTVDAAIDVLKRVPAEYIRDAEVAGKLLSLVAQLSLKEMRSCGSRTLTSAIQLAYAVGQERKTAKIEAVLFANYLEEERGRKSLSEVFQKLCVLPSGF